MFIKGQGTSKDLGIITIYSRYSSLTRKKETRKKKKQIMSSTFIMLVGLKDKF